MQASGAISRPLSHGHKTLIHPLSTEETDEHSFFLTL